LMGIATSWIESILPLYAVNVGTLSVSSVGLLFTYAAFVGIVLQLPVLKAVEKQASGSVILAASLILVGAFGSLAISPELPFLVVALTGAVFADMLSGPLTQTIANWRRQRQEQLTWLPSAQPEISRMPPGRLSEPLSTPWPADCLGWSVFLSQSGPGRF
jgi:hypothetical protein